jgi:hypothetical protein
MNAETIVAGIVAGVDALMTMRTEEVKTPAVVRKSQKGRLKQRRAAGFVRLPLPSLHTEYGYLLRYGVEESGIHPSFLLGESRSLVPDPLHGSFQGPKGHGRFFHAVSALDDYVICKLQLSIWNTRIENTPTTELSLVTYQSKGQAEPVTGPGQS